MGKHRSFIEQVSTLHHPQSLPNIVIGQENSDPPSLQINHDFVDLTDTFWIHPTKGFIQEEKTRVKDEGPGNFKPPSFPSALSVGLLLSELGQAHLCQPVFHQFLALGMGNF